MRRWRVAVPASACVIALLSGRPAHADDFFAGSAVDAPDDPRYVCSGTAALGRCTLREAIQEANSRPGPHRIFLMAVRYILTVSGRGEDLSASGDLDIRNVISLFESGVGRRYCELGGCIPYALETDIDGNGDDRVFHVHPGGRLTLSNLVVTNGGEVDRAPLGGGIANEAGGRLTLFNVLLLGNHGRRGGGIYNRGGADLLNVTLWGNTVGSRSSGGGVYNEGTAAASMQISLQSPLSPSNSRIPASSGMRLRRMIRPSASSCAEKGEAHTSPAGAGRSLTGRHLPTTPPKRTAAEFMPTRV